MKYYNKFLLAAAVVAGLVSVSCEDQPDAFKMTGGVPTVEYIRSVDVEQADVIITSAYMGNQICLVGENLRSIHEMYFNDQKAVLNTSLMTDHTLIVSVPNSIPEEVSNKIYMHTRDGEIATYDFSVFVPGPVITGMSCEYAPAGSVAVLYGDYFIDDPNVPFRMMFGDVEVTDVRNITKNNVTFVVPDDAVADANITVETIYGTETSVFQYMDSRGLMFDFDGATGLGNHGWHDREILTDDTAISGNYVRLGDGDSEMTEDGAWNDGQFSFEYWCGSWDTPQNVTSGDGIALFNLVDFTEWQDMDLKFEMFIPSGNPWSAGAMQIAFEGFDLVTYSGYAIDGYSEVAGANAWVYNNDNDYGAYGRAIYRPWQTTGSFHTDDQWITVTIPLTEFNYDYQGVPTDWTPSKPQDFASLTFFVTGGGLNGTACKPIIKIDNIRAVPNK